MVFLLSLSLDDNNKKNKLLSYFSVIGIVAILPSASGFPLALRVLFITACARVKVNSSLFASICVSLFVIVVV